MEKKRKIMKKRVLKPKTNDLSIRVSKIELEFAKHHAVCGERYKTQKESLDRIEKTIKENSDAINKLFGLSNKGLGGLRVLVIIGGIIASVFGFLKFKNFI